MSSQDRKYFRFRLCRTLALLFLFTSPTKSVSVPEGCLKLVSALMTSKSDEEFNKYLIQCLASVDWKQLSQFSNFAVQNFQDVIEKIPPEIANSAKGNLFLTSVYLICLSYKLYKEVVSLAENYEEYRYRFKELQTKMEPVFQGITKLYLEPRGIDFTTMHAKIENVLEMLNPVCTELVQLTEDVKRDIIKCRLNKGFAIGGVFAASVVCLVAPWSVFSKCVPAIGSVVAFIAYFISLNETHENLNQLQKDTQKLRRDFAQHRVQLQSSLALMKGPAVDIHIRSEGCRDPGRTEDSNSCGFTKIEVNGKDFCPHGRGYNVVVVDGRTGGVLEGKAFDTHWSSGAADRLRGYLNSLNGNKIVLVAIQDEGSRFIKPALDALKRLGATDPILPDYRGSFAFIGYAGENKPWWITQKMAKWGLGPSEISLNIPITNSDLSLNMFIFCSFVYLFVLVICFFTFPEQSRFSVMDLFKTFRPHGTPYARE